MKRKATILLSVLLLLMTVFCQPIAGSIDLENDNNVPVAPNIAQSAWYTKKIELNGYGNKAIEGKLHFKLTPYPVDENEATYPIYDTSGLEEGEDPSHGYLQETIKIVPGLTSYSYEVPFSSDDFVDKQFNDLVERSADKNGNTTELFNYALLHEWGRMAGTDWGNVACVGKIDRGQFPEGEAGDSAYQAALENEDYQVTWGGDPEKHVVGWRYNVNPFTGSYKESSLIFPMGDEAQGHQLLNKINGFKEGTFDYITYYSLKANSAVTYTLNLITRPIAIDMDLDSEENPYIVKPLLPSAAAFDFLKEHEDAYYNPPDEDPDEEEPGDDEEPDYTNYHYIYRYLLTEEASEGIALSGDGKPLIVDVLDYRTDSNILMFTSEEVANTYYTNSVAGINSNKEIHGSVTYSYFDPDSGNFILKDTDKIQLRNWLPKTSVSVTKVWEDENNKAGKRPTSVEVELTADGEPTGKFITLNGNEGPQTFSDLNFYRYDRDEETGTINEIPITYGVREKPVPLYSAKVTGDTGDSAFILTNTYEPSETTETTETTLPSETTETTETTLPSETTESTEMTQPSETTPCEPDNSCNPDTIMIPCDSHPSGDWPLTSQQIAPVVVTKPAESSPTTASTTSLGAGMLPVTADGSMMNLLYAALLLALAGAVTAAHYEMKRRKEK